MLRFIGFVWIIHLALSSKENNNKSISYGCRRGYLYTEILGLRQLVNQESLYRQELERQMREFRRQLKAIDASRCLSSGIKTDFLKAHFENMTETVAAKIESHIENVTSMTDKIAKRMEKIAIVNQQLAKNQDLIIEMVSNVSLDIQEVKSSLGRSIQHNNTIVRTKCNDRKSSHKGKSFAIMVPPSKSNQNMPIHLIISSESTTKITMRSSYSKLNKVFHVKPPGANITLPADFALRWSTGSYLQPRGLIIESTQYVSVYVFHEDAYLAIPARYLGMFYKSFTTDHGKSFVSIMPYGGSASVTLKSMSGISSRKINIPEFSVYHLWSSSSFRNVIISSNQTIAVISGHYKSFTSKIQTLFDSIMPIKSWNSSYIIPLIKDQTSKYDFMYTNASRMSYVQVLNSKALSGFIPQPYKWIGSKKIGSYFVKSVQGTMAVVLWLYSGRIFNSFMCVVPSLSQFSNNYHFWTPFYTDNNFLTVIIKEKDIDGLLMDESSVTKPLMSNTVSTSNKGNYTVVTMAMTHGWHTVQHKDPSVRFGLMMYGGNLNVAYGLPLGLKLE